jgi:general secretion pathway protein K
LPATELKQWTTAWLASQANVAAPLRPLYVEQLGWLGLPRSSIDLLKDYITLLPERTPINLNTASAIAIYASVPSLDLAAAQKLVQTRAQSPLQNMADAQTMLGTTSALSSADFSISSQYFEVRGRLRLGDWVMEELSLVSRINLDVKTIWRRRV